MDINVQEDLLTPTGLLSISNWLLHNGIGKESNDSNLIIYPNGNHKLLFAEILFNSRNVAIRSWDTYITTGVHGSIRMFSQSNDMVAILCFKCVLIYSIDKIKREVNHLEVVNCDGGKHIEWHPTSPNVLTYITNSMDIVLYDIRNAKGVTVIFKSVDCRIGTLGACAWSRCGNVFVVTSLQGEIYYYQLENLDAHHFGLKLANKLNANHKNDDVVSALFIHDDTSITILSISQQFHLDLAIETSFRVAGKADVGLVTSLSTNSDPKPPAETRSLMDSIMMIQVNESSETDEDPSQGDHGTLSDVTPPPGYDISCFRHPLNMNTLAETISMTLPLGRIIMAESFGDMIALAIKTSDDGYCIDVRHATTWQPIESIPFDNPICGVTFRKTSLEQVQLCIFTSESVVSPDSLQGVFFHQGKRATLRLHIHDCASLRIPASPATMESLMLSIQKLHAFVDESFRNLSSRLDKLENLVLDKKVSS